MRHPKSVHLARELVAELFEEVLAQQLFLKRGEHARFHFVAPNRQQVVAATLIAGTEAGSSIDSQSVIQTASTSNTWYPQAGRST